MEMDAGQSELWPVPAVFTQSPWEGPTSGHLLFSPHFPASLTVRRTCVSWYTENREPAYLPQRVVLKLFGLNPFTLIKTIEDPKEL